MSLTASAPVLNLFWDLASVDEAKRVAAAAELVVGDPLAEGRPRLQAWVQGAWVLLSGLQRGGRAGVNRC